MSENLIKGAYKGKCNRSACLKVPALYYNHSTCEHYCVECAQYSMTLDQFDSTRFGAGDKAKYRDGNVYDIATVDFEERLIGLLMHISGGDPEDVSWVRCENVEHIPFKK